MNVIKSKSELRVRKFTSLERDHPIFEVLEGEKIILDIAKDDDGILEIAFHNAAANRIIRLSVLLEVVEECRTMLEKDAE